MRRFGRSEPQVLVAVFFEVLAEVFVYAYVDKVPVVKAAALDGLIGNIKAERLYQVESRAGRRAGSRDCARVMRYLRLKKNYIQHYLIPFRYQISVLHVYISTFSPKKMNFF